MIVTHDNVNEVTLIGSTETGEFKIRSSARAFSILSSGLYSNKIKAIIRELSTNALDAHVAAGTSDIKFDVHLPSILEPWFSVKDYGTGLDADQVKNIYTTYFESTKTKSNDFVGALGLGSKSPFSYTENFTVTAIKGGIKRIYSAFINTMGVPSIAEMGVSKTDEHNGVEIKFSVSKQSDYGAFAHEADEVFTWFKNKPNITGNKINNTKISYTDVDIVPGVHLVGSDGSYHYHNMGPIALMGNIAYPIGKISEAEKHFGHLHEILNCPIVIEFPIGELDFAASREELSFTPSTIKNIRAKLSELSGGLMDKIIKDVDAIENKWEKAFYLDKKRHIKLYRSTVEDYIAKTQFPLLSQGLYSEFKLNAFVDDCVASGITITQYITYGSHNKKYKVSPIKTQTSPQRLFHSIGVNDKTVFVLDDLPRGFTTRMLHHFSNSRNIVIYCLSHDSSDVTARQVAYEEFLNSIYNPPKVVKASSMAVKKRAPRKSGGGLEILNKIRTHYGQRTASWLAVSSMPPSTDTCYYILKDDTSIKESAEVYRLHESMINSGVNGLADINLYRVGKSRLKEVSELKNWVHLSNKIQAELSTIPDDYFVSYATRQAMLDIDFFNAMKCSAYSTIKSKISTTSKYADFIELVEEFNADHPTYGKYCGSNIKVLCHFTKMGKFAVDKTKIQLVYDVMKRYPLIKYLSSAKPFEISTYINLVDK